jgi:hypothetical protein
MDHINKIGKVFNIVAGLDREQHAEEDMPLEILIQLLLPIGTKNI